MDGLVDKDGRPLREVPPLTVMEEGPMVRIRLSRPVENMIFPPEEALRFALAIQEVAKRVLLRVCGIQPPTTQNGCSDDPPTE